ncbi:MAG: hypothetical protein IJI45_12200 [Anaerolineaceae bacterium]|nr:hypothetical protein [Anaerolineaceae bacterium]
MKKNLAIFVNYIILISAIIMLSFTLGKLICMSGNILSISIMHNAYNEVRDFVGLRLAHLLLEGKNPYSVDFLNTLHVPFLYSYTGLMPLLTAVLCRLTGLSIISGSYLLNLIIYACTVFVLCLTIKGFFRDFFDDAVILHNHSKRSLWWNGLMIFFSVAVNTALFFSMFGVPLFNTRSDTISIYLSAVIFYIVFKKKQNTLLLSVLTIVLLTCKQFMILLFVPLFFYYLLFNEKKLAFRYLWQCIIIGLILVIIIQKFFPLYWTETILYQFISNKDYGSFQSALLNIRNFYYRFFMEILLIIIGLVFIFFIGRKKTTFSVKIMEFLENNDYAVYLCMNLIVGTIALLYLAKCDGDGYKYCQDLLAPALFLLSAFIWGKGFAKFLTMNGENLPGRNLLLTVFSSVLCLSAVITHSHFETNYYRLEDVKALINLDEDITRLRGEQIYLGMNSTQYMINHDLWEDPDIDFNDGQIQYFNLSYDKKSIYDKIFFNNEIDDAASRYVQRVNQKTANQEYSLLTTCIDTVIDLDILSENYYPYKTYGIKTEANGMVYDVTLWLPR